MALEIFKTLVWFPLKKKQIERKLQWLFFKRLGLPGPIPCPLSMANLLASEIWRKEKKLGSRNMFNDKKIIVKLNYQLLLLYETYMVQKWQKRMKSIL